jgi:hypothetical protein
MPDPTDLAAAFDRLMTPGGAGEAAPDPLALMAGLMTGTARFHSVFLAPFTPAFAASRAQYLADGSGALTAVAEELARQGASDPAAAARAMLAAAQGMCVVVLALDHGVATVPQLFFGQLPPEIRTQMVAAVGEGIVGTEALATALGELATRIAAAPWPLQVAGPAVDAADLGGYWLDLAAAILAGLDSGLPSLGGPGHERLADLAIWTSQGVISARSGGRIDADDLELLIRIQLLAGQPEAAGQGLDVLIRAGGLDEEQVAELLTAFVDGAIRAGQTPGAATWLAGCRAAWQEALPRCYDLPLALLRLQIAAGRGVEELLPTARLLVAADRKAARNDLTKEPIWQVHADPGEVLDTAAAAIAIDRSTSFVVKRLEARTLPWCRREDQIRLPQRTLAGWLAIMQEFALLT